MYRDIKGYGGGEVYEYTSSLGHDAEIVGEAVNVVAAHTLHLYEQGVIKPGEYCRIARHLVTLLEDPPVVYEVGGGYEDVWEAIEAWLTGKAGSVAGEIWIGRSRNDHVSAALRLRAIRGSIRVMRGINRLRRNLIDKAAGSRDKWILLHTHSQPSQLAPASCLLLAWEESLAGIYAEYKRVVEALNRSPLGASAGAGSIAPLNPSRLAGLLGFKELLHNPVYATGSRLDLSVYTAVTAMLLVELSRAAEDLMILSSPYVGAVVLPDSHVATSSVMPHKRNPVTLEVLRARAKLAVSMLSGLLSVQAGLPSGYSLDLQEINPVLYGLESIAVMALEIMDGVVRGLKWNDEALRRMQEGFIGYGAELAEYISLRDGVPFREAYRAVAEGVNEGRIGELLQGTGVGSPVELASERSTGCTGETDLTPLVERLSVDDSYLAGLEKDVSEALGGLKEAITGTLKGCGGES